MANRSTGRKAAPTRKLKKEQGASAPSTPQDWNSRRSSRKERSRSTGSGVEEIPCSAVGSGTGPQRMTLHACGFQRRS